MNTKTPPSNTNTSPFIIVTQSYVDHHALIHQVCRGFFEESIELWFRELNAAKPANAANKGQKPQEKPVFEEYKRFEYYQSQGRIIIPSFIGKQEFRESLAPIMQVYPEPSLLFLGDINTYSIQLQEGLLKLLEEPPHNLQIVMFAHSSSSLLPTIRSRSRIITLPVSAVFALMNKKLKEKVETKLPKPAEFTKKLLLDQVTPADVSSIDPSKLERDEIDFWLWQLGVNLSFIYEQNPRKLISFTLKRVLEAQKYNTNNVQKKFVLMSLVG